MQLPLTEQSVESLPINSKENPVLVLCPLDNYGYRVAVVFRNKAQRAGNGCSLANRCNAVAGRHSSALWVGVSAPMDRVAPFAKGEAIAGKPRLAMNADTPTVSALIEWTEYLFQSAHRSLNLETSVGSRKYAQLRLPG